MLDTVVSQASEFIETVVRLRGPYCRHVRCHPHGEIDTDFDIYGPITPVETPEPPPVGDFAFQGGAGALNVEPMVTVCQQAPCVCRASAGDAATTLPWPHEDPPEDAPPAGSAPDSPPPPPKPQPGGFSLNSLPDNGPARETAPQRSILNVSPND
jgi:hypothetical protein